MHLCVRLRADGRVPPVRRTSRRSYVRHHAPRELTCLIAGSWHGVGTKAPRRRTSRLARARWQPSTTSPRSTKRAAMSRIRQARSLHSRAALRPMCGKGARARSRCRQTDCTCGCSVSRPPASLPPSHHHLRSYRIHAAGGSGGTAGVSAEGYGAEVWGDYVLTAGQSLTVLVGGRGGDNYHGGGGGGKCDPACLRGMLRSRSTRR